MHTPDGIPAVAVIACYCGDLTEGEKVFKPLRAFGSMRPFSSGAYFLNFLGEEGEDTIKAAFGPNYDRLTAIKKKYDPKNFFCMNQNIKPEV